jgi:acetolactate synthase regulatory subunit
MQKNYWLIKCNHTPETIDRIMMQFRKRGLMINSLEYKKVDFTSATCKIEFEEVADQADKIYKNMLRSVDINGIEIAK